MANDPLKLHIDVNIEKGSKAIEKLQNINKEIEKAINLAKKLNNAFNDLSKFTNTLSSLANSTKTFSSAFKDLTNAQKTNTTNATKMLGIYNQQSRQLRTLKADIKDLIASGNANNSMLQAEANAYKNLQAKINETNNKFKELTATQEKAKQQTFGMKVAVANFMALQINMFLQKMVYGFKDLIASVSKAGIELDALRNTFMAATGGWQQGGQEMNWLIDMSSRLGLSFGDVSDSYAKFMTSFTRSGGTIEQSRQIFEDISTAMVNLHLPAERMQGVFIALEQMANKGTVQAEELKRQLGNALPAAFEIGAESMGILPAKLMDLMKKGEVFSKDFLPNFAQAVKENLGQGIDIAVNQFNASLGRLNTSVSLLKMEVGQGLNEALKPLVDLAIPVVNALANMARFFNENAVAGALLKGVLVGLTVTAIPALLSLIAQIGVALKAMFPALAAINISLGGLPLVIGAVVTGLSSLGFWLHDVAKKASDITPYMGMREQIVELTKSVTELDLSTQDGQKALEKYKQEFPTLTQYLIENKKTLDQLTLAEFEQIKALGIADKQTQALAKREEQLNKVQYKLLAAWLVVWDRIVYIVTVACQNIKTSIDWLWSTITKVATRVDNFFGFTVNARIAESTRILEKYNKALDKAKKDNNQDKIAYWNEMIKNEQEILDIFKKRKELKDASKPNEQKLGGGGFFDAVNDRVITNATKNYERALEEIEKSSKATTLGLKVAQTAHIGLEKATNKATKAKQKHSKAIKDEWQKLEENIKKTEEAIRVGKLKKQDTTELEKAYKKLKDQQDAVNESLKNLTDTSKSSYQQMQDTLSALREMGIETLAGGGDASGIAAQYKAQRDKIEAIDKKWEELTSTQDNSYEGLKKQQKAASNLYKTMLLNSSQYSSSEIEAQKHLLKSLNLKVKQVDLEAKHQEAIQITQKTAKDFSDTVLDSLLSFDKSRDFWEDFQNSAIAAFKTIAAAWTKRVINQMIVDIQSSFSGASTGGGTGLFSGILGSIGSLFSGKGGASGSDSETGFGKIIAESEGVAEGLSFKTIPALQQASEAVSALQSPSDNAANSLANMAMSTPTAALGMIGMATSMSVLSPACVKAAPALIQMSAALQGIATSAAQAATAMAELAVATAAESVAKIPYIGGFLAPIAAAATGAAIAAGGIMAGVGIAAGSTMAGAGQALGGNLSKLGSLGGNSKVVAHAKGGVVSSPTTFPMAGGNIGLAGEAGTEVIAPAKRMSNGEVGIGAVQPNVTVNNYANAAVEVIRRPNNEMEIKISEFNAMMSSSRTNRGFTNAQQRLSTKGKQIG